MTEQEVNKAALNALRSYYRFRVKSGTPEVVADVRGAGGIIADGSYAFQTPDGEHFLATVESTSADTRDEVLYKVQYWLLLWDCAVVASILVLFLFGWMYLSDYLIVKQYGVGLTLVGLVLATFVISSIFYLLMRRLRRYRYIYAIEQFKRYHANEQWVAIAEDVFENHQDRKYLELRNQCIYNGFGLIIVDKALKSYLAITPARRELFGHNRQIVQFFTENQISRLLKRSANIQAWWKKFSRGVPLKFTSADPQYLLRFRRPVFNQIIIFGITWVMIGGIIYEEWQQRPIRYVDQETYEEEVVTRQVQSDPEPRRAIILAGDSIYVRPFNDKAIPYLLWLQSQEQLAAVASLNRTGSDILIGMFDDALIVYDCERLYNFRTTMYVLQEGIYPDFETATRRMSELIAEGLKVSTLWLGCFSESDQRYILYYDMLLETRSEAEELAKDYRNALKNKRLNTNISIKTLIPGKKD